MLVGHLTEWGSNVKWNGLRCVSQKTRLTVRRYSTENRQTKIWNQKSDVHIFQSSSGYSFEFDHIMRRYKTVYECVFAEQTGELSNK